MKAFLFAVLVIVAHAQVDNSFVDDSWLNHLLDASFFYHDAHDLLLTVTHDSCYYTTIIDRGNYERTLLDHKVQAEVFVGQNMHNPLKAHPTTWEEMLNRYQDRLANFHCLDKHIYTLDISLISLFRMPGLTPGYILWAENCTGDDEKFCHWDWFEGITKEFLIKKSLKMMN